VAAYSLYRFAYIFYVKMVTAESMVVFDYSSKVETAEKQILGVVY